MPTLPCYHNPPDPDAWHQITAPGGYEAWQFHAEDRSANIRIAGVLGQGYDFDLDYRRKYLRYLKRPTVHAPPVPADYPRACFELYRGGKRCAFFSYRAPDPRDFAASADRLDVRVGPNRLSKEQGGLILNWSAVQSSPGNQSGTPLEAQLVFRPRNVQAALDRPLFSNDPKHRWVIPSALCEVTGELTFEGERIAFSGVGHHDHRYGAAPLQLTARHWLGGHVLLNDRLLMFHLIKPRDSHSPIQSTLLETTESNSRDIASSVWATWRFMQRYPRTIHFGEHLRLTNPRKLTDGNSLCYDAQATGQAGIVYCSAF
jgi:hypothetical protein